MSAADRLLAVERALHAIHRPGARMPAGIPCPVCHAGATAAIAAYELADVIDDLPGPIANRLLGAGPLGEPAR